ncbi:unnamed protein product [Schistosoma margrebowiei]|uniref:Uncharacterized protein n=1 Tax=Schistosoma margrebowiei TaxID=48269 RepID=A0A183M3X3_9TREM|nr:unnamed protein product [Schistosoma margrebowiei]
MLHNHPCSSSWMVCDPWTRRLSSEEKENLKPVILPCESADEVIESIKDRTGKQVTAADVKGVKATFSIGVTDNSGRCRTVMFAWEKRSDVIWILDQFEEIIGDTMLTETFVMDCA